eukprot:CAMPEP_0168317560 /NCGR_PEP_ID=MMETSP0210-20121227/26011_1 /TAXON_ID=40633 /ORGANISM="Condylostoma magnum, Strain COL2" /LENGTH=61 /DNA_ID=CAMNT_0008318135 /DNA_START=81 /DNA_END=266 /DNA_ORIENTATION=+
MAESKISTITSPPGMSIITPVIAGATTPPIFAIAFPHPTPVPLMYVGYSSAFKVYKPAQLI